jgi:uncharacterized protein YegJ (DUF2314 family)
MYYMRTAIAAIALTAPTLGLAQTVVERAKADELAFMGDEEPAMKRAFQKARATLDQFLEQAKSPPAGTVSYSLKLGIREGRDVEYFWIGKFTQTESGFTGTINNEPRMVKSVKFGQQYAFPREHIVDWTYIDRDERRMVGNFTMCALLTKESQAEQEATKKRFGLKCED